MCHASHLLKYLLSLNPSLALVSQRDELKWSWKPGKSHPKCNHCHKLGYMIDRCYVVHGCLAQSTVVAQTAPSLSLVIGPLIHLSSMTLRNGMKNNLRHLVPLLLLHTQALCFGLTQSTYLGPWVLDFVATYHISSNKSFFSSLSTSYFVLSVTMTNCSQAPSHGVCTIHLFPSPSIDNVLYVSRSQFNLLSISCLTHSFDCVILLIKTPFSFKTGVQD